MNKKRKRIGIFLALIVCVAIAGGILVPAAGWLRPYFTQKIHHVLQNMLSEQLQQQVKIEKIQLQYPDQLHLAAISWPSTQGDTLLYLKKVHIDIGLQEFLLYNRLHIDKMTVHEGYLDLLKLYTKQDSGLAPPPPSSDEEGGGPNKASFLALKELRLKQLRIYVDSSFHAALDTSLLVEVDATFLNIRADSTAFSAEMSTLQAQELHRAFHLKQGKAHMYWQVQDKQWHISELHLQTPQSYLQASQITLGLPSSPKDLAFPFHIQLDSAYVSLSEWAPYWKALPFSDKNLHFALEAQGYGNDFQGRLMGLRISDVLQLQARFAYTVQGPQYHCALHIEQAQLQSHALTPFLPPEVGTWPEKLGTLEYAGWIRATPAHLQGEGTLQTALGSFTFDAEAYDLHLPGPLKYRGTLQSDTLYLVPDELPLPLSSIGLETQFEGSVPNTVNLEADIRYATLPNYSLQRIHLQAHYQDHSLQLHTQATDPSLRYSATLHWQKKQLQHTLSAQMNLRHLNVQALGLSKKPLQVRTQAAVALQGTRWEEALGHILLKDTYLQGQKASVWEKEMTLEIKPSPTQGYELSLQSHALSTQLHSTQKPLAALSHVYQSTLAALPLGQQRPSPSPMYYRSTGHIQLKPFARYWALIADPAPRFSKESYLQFELHSDSSQYEAHIALNVDTLHWLKSQIYANKATFFYHKPIDTAAEGQLQYSAHRYAIKPFTLDAPFLTLKWKGKTAQLQIGVAQETAPSYARLEADLRYVDDIWRISFADSRLQALGQPWHFTSHSHMHGSPEEGLHKVDLRLQHKEQTLSVLGKWSASQRQLQAHLQYFALENLNPLLKGELSGILEGTWTLAKPSEPLTFSHLLRAKNLSINGTLMGNATLELDLDPQVADLLQIQGHLQQGRGHMRLEGKLHLRDQTHFLRLQATEMPTHIISPLLDPVFVNIRGHFDGSITSTGQDFAHTPEIYGTLTVQDGYMLLDYLKADMYMQGDIRFSGQEILLTDLIAKDGQRGTLNLEGGLQLAGLAPPKLQLRIDVSNYQAIDTHSVDNDLYYGQGYASGNISLSGTTRYAIVEGSLRTESGTRLYLPMQGEENLQAHAFIQFTDGKALPQLPLATPEPEKGISLALDLDVQPGSYAEIITQDTPPEYLRFIGEGDLRLVFDTQKGFSVFGALDLTQGTYRFSPYALFYGLLTKAFDIEAGSQIQWNGSPVEVVAALRMRHNQWVSAAPLRDFGETQIEEEGRVQTDIIIDVSGPLLSPSIAFDLEISDFEEDSPFLQHLRSDEQARKQQVLSLLYFRRFTPPEGLASATQADNSGLLLGVGEAFTEQLNTLLSDIDEDLLLGVDFASRRLSLSYALLQGRLRLQREAALLPNTTSIAQQISSIVGDWNIEYLLSRNDGKWRLRGYFNTLDDAQQRFGRGPFVTGISFRYLSRFDRWFYFPSKRADKKPK